MKNWSILIIIILIVLLAGFYENKYLENTSKYLITDINYIKVLLVNKDIDGAEINLNSLKNDFQNVYDTWMIFIKHEDVKNIEENINILKTYIDNRDLENAVVCAENIKYNIEYIIKTNKVNIYTLI